MIDDLLKERIDHYSKSITNALECNDTITALKSYAIVKELKYIYVQVKQGNNQEQSTSKSLEAFYTTKEVAALFKRHTSTITKYANKYQGIMYNGEWHFPINVVHDILSITNIEKRRGRKPRRDPRQEES